MLDSCMECSKLQVVLLQRARVLHDVEAADVGRAAEALDRTIRYHAGCLDPTVVSEGACVERSRADGTVGKGCHAITSFRMDEPTRERHVGKHTDGTPQSHNGRLTPPPI